MKLFILFQTDQYKDPKTKVFFGCFETFDLANQAAKDNDLYSHDSEVIIEDTILNLFGER